MISFTGRALLLDIEGTTSSCAFVYEVGSLSRRGMVELLREHWDELAVVQARADRRDAGTTFAADCTRPGVTCREVHRLMDGDVKATGLRNSRADLARGLRFGRAVLACLPRCTGRLRRWRKGLDVRIDSSGSVGRKRVLAHTTQAI